MVLSRAIAAFSLLAASCTYPTDSSMYEVPGAGRPAQGPFTVVASVPANGDTGVLLGSAISLRFSGAPDPSAAAFPTITLRSGLSFDFAIRVDLVENEVQIQPRSPLVANCQYAVIVSTGMRSLAGFPLAAPYLLRFTTGSIRGGGPASPAWRSLATDVQPLFDGSCVAGCHDARNFAGGLSLASGASAEHLLGVRSIEEPGLARVKPSDPGSSYLLRKLLGTPDIAHRRMPIGDPWPADRIRTVSDWILTGAQP